MTPEEIVLSYRVPVVTDFDLLVVAFSYLLQFANESDASISATEENGWFLIVVHFQSKAQGEVFRSSFDDQDTLLWPTEIKTPRRGFAPLFSVLPRTVLDSALAASMSRLRRASSRKR